MLLECISFPPLILKVIQHERIFKSLGNPTFPKWRIFMWNYTPLFKKMMEDFIRIQNEPKLNEHQLRSLIDLALDLGPEEWFIELTDRLNARMLVREKIL